MADLRRILHEQGHRVSPDLISTIIKDAGFKWRKARVVLTSNDPNYRTKVDRIVKILSELKSDEAFFAIDEFGPFEVKKRGGRKRVAPGEDYSVPQRQKSKGCLIITAALELSRNQVTHFYSDKKNTQEMIKMMDLLRSQYRNVIESVFSGMARAIIHNSDYCSVEAAKDAIDRYYTERNEYFQAYPKRAGRKIWGQERVRSELCESNNCKDPLYCW